VLANPSGTVGSLLEGGRLHKVSETLLGSQPEALHDLTAVRVGDICTYCVEEASGEVVRLQVGIGFEDLVLTLTCRQERDNIGHSDLHPSDAGTATTLVRIDGDPVE
jgi:hypothetical protein